ncbi:MAG: hypothetical protein WC827_01530 [Candidatus Paceibacterota bacterium]|jgi:hypothetical protein
MEDEKITKADFYKLIACVFFFILIYLPKNSLGTVAESIMHFLTLNLTNYPYQNPPIFFSVGEALASIAILLAIYQFRKEEWFIALRVKSYIQPVVFITLSLGVIFSIISSIILIENPVYVFQLSIFWQILASILIAFSILFLFVQATNKKLFKVENSRKFYEVMVRELSRSNPERLNVILNALLENLDNICQFAKQDYNNKGTQSAINILDVILGEASIVDLITTKRLDALRYIIFILEEHKLTEQRVRGFPRIVRNLFSDQNSYLYTHLDKSGLALSTNLYGSLFGSTFILSNFNIFSWPSIDYKMQSGLNNIQIEVFIEALSQAIEAYLKTGLAPARHINDGLSHLSSIFNNLCLEINTEEERGVDTKYVLKDKWWSLHIIANFLGHDYPFLAYEDEFNQVVIEREKTATEAGFYSNSTINEGIAATLYQAFTHLDYIKHTNDTYHTVLELLHGMIYESQYKQGYIAPFEKRIWEQIAINVIKKHYPGVLRSYLTFFGFALATSADRKGRGWKYEQTERMRRLLYIDLKPLLDTDTLMVNEKFMKDVLLPDDMKYRYGKFFYTMGFGRGPEVEITEPPTGSISALDGVDLNDRSLI